MVKTTTSPHPINHISLFTPSTCLPEGVTAMECVIDADCEMIPVTNFNDVEITIMPAPSLAEST